MSGRQAEPRKLHDSTGTLSVGSAQMLAMVRIFQAGHDLVHFALNHVRSSLLRQEAQVLAMGFALEHLSLAKWS